MHDHQYLNMAAMSFGHSKTMGSLSRVSVVVLHLLCIFPQGGLSRSRPTEENVKSYTDKISDGLLNLDPFSFMVADKYKSYVDGTNSLTKNRAVSLVYEEIKGDDLVEEMSVTLSEILGKKMVALQKSVKAAEAIAKLYPWKREMEISDVHYYNSKTSVTPYDGEDIMVFSERFGKNVNLSFSSVHIPVEIYEGSNDILNGLNWTAGLDAQFKLNYEDDPDILWQYFGSQSGFMRTYPATNWKDDGVDLYDVRRQSWYTQGSSSPKDMLILIDTSGSTYGQSLQLMKNAVKSILNTLGENDFVNVVGFSETATFVSKCFNHTAFVQANFRNKKQLERDVDKLEALGQADFTVAITFAFEKFKEFARNETNDENNMGANCNKVIMLLTDGGTDNAEDVFAEYNWPNKSVRVFTYAVGPTPNPIHAIRWMACANRGYFSQIPAMGAIRSRVQDYVRVLERPLAIAQAEHSLWTSSHRSIYYSSNQWMAYTEHLNKQTQEEDKAKQIYWELTFDPREYIPVLSRPQVIKNKKSFEWGNIYEDHLGLGMMTTVTLPVYNHTLESSNQTILGVMGVDVTTAQLEAHTPFSKIGPNGYAFAINPNGYVVFHPNLKTLGKFMNEPPNIDLLELEVDGDNPKLVQVRTEMIKGETDNLVLESRYLSPCQRYVSYGQASYSFIPIKNTTFRLGLSIPTYQKKWAKFTGNRDLNEFSVKQSNDRVIFIAPWAYHKDKDVNKDLGPNISDITDLLKADDNPDNWNLDLLYHLMWDVKIADEFVTFTQALSNDTDSNNDGNETDVKATFIMGNSGMTFVSPTSEAEYFMKMRDLRKSSLHTRTLRSKGYIFMADHIIHNRSSTAPEPHINIAWAVKFLEKNERGEEIPYDKPAVAGVRVSHTQVMKAVHESVGKVANGLDLMTCEDPSLVCYLIDDGGFLIASSRDDARGQVGRFFGLVDPPLMSAMNGTVFDRTVQYDFQAACKIKKENSSSFGVRSFTVPTLNLVSEVLTTGFWTSKVSWAFSSFNFISWLFSPTVEVMAENREANEKECVKSIQQYYYVKKTPFSHHGEVQCDNRTRTYSAVRVNKTNLLFILADRVHEDCDEFFPPVGQAPREITAEEEEEIICELAQNPRKRVQDYSCYHSDSNEDQTECGCGCLHPSWMSVYSVVLLVVLRWLSVL